MSIFENIFCSRIKDELETWKKNNSELTAKLDAGAAKKKDVESALAACRSEKEKISGKLSDAEKTIDALKKQSAPDPKRIFWENKYPKADIVYLGRLIPKAEGEGFERIPVDVRFFGYVQDFEIRNFLGDEGLIVNDKGECEDLALEVCKQIKKKDGLFPYKYSIREWGVSEMWMVISESRATLAQGLGVDCDDWACIQHNAMRMAGIPEWRLRMVAGYTWGKDGRGGGGHLTNYVLDDELEVWRHINSTTRSDKLPANFSELPPTNDKKDSIGIKDVWFSFNSEFSWHKFETRASENEFSEEERMKNFRII